MAQRNKQLQRLLAQLTAAERVHLSAVAPDRAALEPLLWDTAPIQQGGEIISHRDFGLRVTHVLARQGEHVNLQISALAMLWLALQTSLSWGSDRYLVLIEWQRHASARKDRQALNAWANSGPSHPNVALGLNGAPVMPDNQWDAELRDDVILLRDRIQDVSGVLQACEAVAAALQERDEFREFIDGLLRETLTDCSSRLEILHREVQEAIGEIPLPGPDPDTTRWLETIFHRELNGSWAETQAPPRRMVVRLITWEEQQAREAFGRRLQRLRVENAVSLETLANAVRLDRAAMTATEQGETSVTLDQITTLANQLGLSPTELVED